MRFATLLFALLLLAPIAAHAQPGQAADAAAPTERPAPDPADVASIDAILTAVYASISGPIGEPRDWDRFLSLHHPEARLMPTAPLPGGRDTLLVWTPEQYIERSEALLVSTGFSESEIARQVQRYGPVVHVFSAYAGGFEQEGRADIRGVNSFQLMHDGDRWWILSIFWAASTPDRPLPDWARGE